VPQIDAPSHGERVGIFAVAIGLTGGEITPVSAVITVVKRERLKMTCGVTLSVTRWFENGFFLFCRFE